MKLIQYAVVIQSPFHTTTFKSFIVIAALCLILRIWYVGSLYQDDGLWFTVAEEMLRGKALYREIFFDKPPGLPLLYAGLFKVFGPHIVTIRLFTICYSLLVSILLYVFGSRLYDKRTGLIAAALFAVFSTTYISGDMQSLNTEFLMVPFYLAGAYLFIRAAEDFICTSHSRGGAARLAFAGGTMAGVAFQINPKGAFDLIFFALLLIAARRWNTRDVQLSKAPGTLKYIVAASRVFACGVAGLIFASLPFMVYIAATQSLSRYKLYVWDWGFRYANYYPLSRAGEMFLHYGTDYFLINNTLLVALIIIATLRIRQLLRYAKVRRAENTENPGQPNQDSELNVCDPSKLDAALLIWFAVSFLGVAAGGRFFAHYYFQTLPSLSLIGARGLVVALSWLRSRNRLVLRIAIALLISGFAYTLSRTHRDTWVRAVQWMRGEKSQVNNEARIVAATVRDIFDPINTAARVGAEAMREGGPRIRAAGGPADYVFVWGNWPEVYYWSGLLPASGYLSTQPLTGVPADVWYGAGEYRSILDKDVTAAARIELARELEQAKPKYIVDELGFREPRLSIRGYPELEDVMSSYERYDQGKDVPLYIRRSSEDR